MLQYLSVAQCNGNLKMSWIILYYIVSELSFTLFQKKKKDNNLFKKKIVIFCEGVQDHL